MSTEVLPTPQSLEVKVKHSRIWDYERRTAILKVGNKRYKVHQECPVGYPLKSEWVVNKRQMKLLLKEYPDLWIWKRDEYFDGMEDMIVRSDMEWTVIEPDRHTKILWDLDNFRYRVKYHSDTDIFEVYDVAIGGFSLKFGGKSRLI